MTDAVVVGAGPNGLAAAIELARNGRSVHVVEARDTIGGGSRSAELTLPGFVHDVCSAIHPLAAASPFLRALPLAAHGLEFVHPEAPLAHPLDDGTAVLLERSVEATSQGLGPDGPAYRRLLAPLVREAETLLPEILAPLHVSRHPLLLARFGMSALRSAVDLAGIFQGQRARALLAGMASHSMLPLERRPTAAFAITLATLGHAVGWPAARGGSQRIVDALAAHLRSLGGTIETGRRIVTVGEVGDARAVLFDTSPRALASMAADRLPTGYRRALERFRYGPGVCKVDLALDGAIPWRAAEAARGGTVHLGGTLGEIAASEAAVARGEHPERPFVILAQQSRFDDSRAPAGQHAVWAYCHVPAGSTVDMSARIEAQVERFAPGFRERILARAVTTAAELERYNANYVGGDINGGVQDLWQHFTRPVASLDPYRTPVRSLYLCSSATPPGGGVHGLCGYFAARSALRGALA